MKRLCARYALALMCAVASFLLTNGTPAAESAQPVRAGALERPRFTSLQVEIWPEFDRRAQVLVILRGEIAADVALPATVSLRIPASSNPTAVAFGTAPDSKLFNLEHERTYADVFTTLRFTTSHRLVHVEYYDRLAPDLPDRRFKYRYEWPGDLAVDQLSVLFQEPVAASDILVKPELGSAIKGPDGLLYRKAELGSFDAGKRLLVEIGYTKTDPRTSSEMLGLSAADSTSAPASGSATALPGWLPIVVISAVLLIGAGAVLLWWRLRRRASRASPSGVDSCPQCGSRLDSDDRFCSKCGAPVPNR